MQLIGKWAYTARILYWKPYSTMTCQLNAMRVASQRTHLGYTSNHVLNETLDCTEASNVFPAALPYRQGDLVRFARNEPDVHVNVADILRQSPPRALDGDLSGFDGDLNSLREFELLGLENVLHLRPRDR